jgi:hypothetical protein
MVLFRPALQRAIACAIGKVHRFAAVTVRRHGPLKG